MSLPLYKRRKVQGYNVPQPGGPKGPSATINRGVHSKTNAVGGHMMENDLRNKDRLEIREFVMNNIPPVFSFMEDYEWSNQDARKYAEKLIQAYGEPDEHGTNMMSWYKRDGFDIVTVKDESIKHDFPMPHKDFVYSSKHLSDSENEQMKEHISLFQQVTGSIHFDPLKKEVTARCGKLIKNAVTLGFVQDGINTPEIITQEEYSRRIQGNEVPQWYKDNLREEGEEKK